MLANDTLKEGKNNDTDNDVDNLKEKLMIYYGQTIALMISTIVHKFNKRFRNTTIKSLFDTFFLYAQSDITR